MLTHSITIHTYINDTHLDLFDLICHGHCMKTLSHIHFSDVALICHGFNVSVTIDYLVFTNRLNICSSFEEINQMKAEVLSTRATCEQIQRQYQLLTAQNEMFKVCEGKSFYC